MGEELSSSNKQVVNNFKKTYRFNYNVVKNVFGLFAEDSEKLIYCAISGEKGKRNFIEDYYELVICEEEALRLFYEAEYELTVSKLN